MRAIYLAGLVTSILGVIPAHMNDELKRYSFTEYHMGVDARLVVYATSQAQAETACKAAFDRIAQLDWVMSDYRKDSELMKLCAQAGKGPVKVSKDMMRVLTAAKQFARDTDGAVDVSIGPLIQLWRKARKTAVLPSQAEIDTARKLVNYKNIWLNKSESKVWLPVEGTLLDLGGIGKGFADDEAMKVLRKHGIKSALIQMGGDILVSNAPPNTNGWTIEVPNASDTKGPKEMTFQNCAISTSGDTEQYVIIGGKQYSHVVDPHTGWALTSRAQATVIARDGLTSDPLSKALYLLDEKARDRVLKKYKVSRYYLRVLKGTEEN